MRRREFEEGEGLVKGLEEGEGLIEELEGGCWAPAVGWLTDRPLAVTGLTEGVQAWKERCEREC